MRLFPVHTLATIFHIGIQLFVPRRFSGVGNINPALCPAWCANLALIRSIGNRVFCQCFGQCCLLGFVRGSLAGLSGNGRLVRGFLLLLLCVNLRQHALAVFGGIKTDLQTDADFADAERTVKWCKEVEDRLDAAKQHALSQTASIDDLFRTIDAIKEEARQKRLTLDKLVKAEKENRKAEIVYEALPQDDPAVRQPDISRAREILGWEPTVGLADGLRMTIAGTTRAPGR